jgi:hypothetical protein
MAGRLIATHNPNLPVLGDVEHAVILRAVKERQSRVESVGDLDEAGTVTQLTEIMEGGREAFQYRQSIYQTHWEGSIDASSPQTFRDSSPSTIAVRKGQKRS